MSTELLAERVNTTATSLLGLIGIDADPIKAANTFCSQHF